MYCGEVNKDLQSVVLADGPVEQLFVAVFEIRNELDPRLSVEHRPADVVYALIIRLRLWLRIDAILKFKLKMDRN